MRGFQGGRGLDRAQGSLERARGRFANPQLRLEELRSLFQEPQPPQEPAGTGTAA